MDKDVAVDPYCLEFASFGDHRGFVFYGRSVRPEKSLGETCNPMIGSMDFNHETLDSETWVVTFTILLNFYKKVFANHQKKTDIQLQPVEGDPTIKQFHLCCQADGVQ